VLDLAQQEERVVDGHDRREVLVDRRRLDSQPARHFRQTQAVDPFFGHHVQRDVEDLRDGLLAPGGHAGHRAVVRPGMRSTCSLTMFIIVACIVLDSGSYWS